MGCLSVDLVADKRGIWKPKVHNICILTFNFFLLVPTKISIHYILLLVITFPYDYIVITFSSPWT